MPQTIESAAITPELVRLEGRRAAVMHVAGAPAELPSLLREAFEMTMQQIASSGGQVVGPPFARYASLGDRIDADVGFPCMGPLAASERVHETSLPAGRAVVATFVGPYEEIAAAWDRVEGWMREHGLESAAAPWESYLTGPDDPGLPVTQITFPVR